MKVITHTQLISLHFRYVGTNTSWMYIKGSTLKGSTLLQNFGRNRGTASKTCYLFR